MKWKDRGSRINLTEPGSSELRLAHFRLSIHRHIDYPKDVWFMSCHGLFSMAPARSKRLARVKVEAVAKVGRMLCDALTELEMVE